MEELHEEELNEDESNRVELDTGIVKEIRIIPASTPKDTKILFKLQADDQEEPIEREVLAGMIITALTEQEYYMSICGNALPTVVFMGNELRNPATFIWNLVYSSLIFAIGESNWDELAAIHNALDELQNMVLDRYSVLREYDETGM